MKQSVQSNIRNGIFKAVLTGSLMIGAASVFAADSGNITIQGEIEAVNEIVVTPVTGYDTLNLAANAADQQVATINEKNNDPDGYTVTLVSANAAAASSSQARLNAADGDNSQVVNYSMKYGVVAAEATVTLNGSGSAVVSSTTAASLEAGNEKSLLISFTGDTWKNADTYSDTLTMTIAAK